MDKDHLKVHSLTDSHEQEYHKEKEGYVEDQGAEIFEASIRRSSRLQIKKKMSPCSQVIFKSYKHTSKYTMKSSKTSLKEDKPISDIKIQKDKTHKKEKNGEVLEDTTSMKSSIKYHVRAKDGIQLIVDLNLKRSDWLRSMERAVCVCQNHFKPEFESFRKEVECLGGGNDQTTLSDASMNSYVQDKFSIKSMGREFGKTLPSRVEKEVNNWSENCSPDVEYLENVEFSSEKGSRTGRVYLENLLTSTTEVNQEMDGNHRQAMVENREMINSTEGMEVEVSRDENVFDDGSKRKKHYHKSDHIDGQSHERILRSTKMLGGQIVESGGHVIRRSYRLHSK